MRPDKKTLIRLYVDRGLSLRAIAEKLGVHPGTAHYYIKRAGIESRDNAKRSKLRGYRLETLRKGIEEKGVRGLARELGVHENTLRHYLKGAR